MQMIIYYSYCKKALHVFVIIFLIIFMINRIIYLLKDYKYTSYLIV